MPIIDIRLLIFGASILSALYSSPGGGGGSIPWPYNEKLLSVYSIEKTSPSSTFLLFARIFATLSASSDALLINSFFILSLSASENEDVYVKLKSGDCGTFTGNIIHQSGIGQYSVPV